MLRSVEGIRINCICPAYTDTPLVKPILQNEKIRNEIEKYGLLRFVFYLIHSFGNRGFA